MLNNRPSQKWESAVLNHLRDQLKLIALLNPNTLLALTPRQKPLVPFPSLALKFLARQQHAVINLDWQRFPEPKLFIQGRWNTAKQPDVLIYNKNVVALSSSLQSSDLKIKPSWSDNVPFIRSLRDNHVGLFKKLLKPSQSTCPKRTISRRRSNSALTLSRSTRIASISSSIFLRESSNAFLTSETSLKPYRNLQLPMKTKKEGERGETHLGKISIKSTLEFGSPGEIRTLAKHK